MFAQTVLASWLQASARTHTSERLRLLVLVPVIAVAIFNVLRTASGVLQEKLLNAPQLMLMSETYCTPTVTEQLEYFRLTSEEKCSSSTGRCWGQQKIPLKRPESWQLKVSTMFSLSLDASRSLCGLGWIERTCEFSNKLQSSFQVIWQSQ